MVGTGADASFGAVGMSANPFVTSMTNIKIAFSTAEHFVPDWSILYESTAIAREADNIGSKRFQFVPFGTQLVILSGGWLSQTQLGEHSTIFSV